MSTVVCQRLQSCLESQLVETRTLRLIVASLKVPHLSESNNTVYVSDNKYISSNSDSDLQGGWSSLQTLSNISQSPKESLVDRESSYVPPLLINQSSFKLSDKSLELCTENLGSETGTTDITESSTTFSFSESDEEMSRKSPTNSSCREQFMKYSRQHMESSCRKVNNSRNFPPPLTTMSGVSSLQVRSHREGGRLVIEAVEAPPRHSCFQAERSDGRLRLCFLKDNYCTSTTSSNYSEVAATEENEESGQDNNVEKYEADIEEQDEEGFEEQEAAEASTESDAYVLIREDMEDGNSFDVGVENGIKKFQWPSRCKEGGLGNGRLCNWEPFCVATP